MASAVVDKLSKLNPFGKSKVDDDDKGQAIEIDSVGGGGKASKKANQKKDQLKVSKALRSVLVHEGILSEEQAAVDAGPGHIPPPLKQLLDKPHINIPAEVTDRSHPISEYFISSSHNTYLVAHQLTGSSKAEAYEIALGTGSRCVEIDAWDGEEDKNEPKVTHGYTLVSHISFRSVCEAMRDVVDKEAAEPSGEDGYKAAPIMLSLENHCSPQGQKRLVEIMKEVWGDRLLSKRVRDEGTAEQEGTGKPVTLNELKNKICVIVEYHFPDEPDSSDEEVDDPEEDAKNKAERKEYAKKKKEAPKTIIPELAELGVYAQSVKPRDQSWLEGELRDGPHDHLINVSESGLGELMPKMIPNISKHNSKHLMRVYPKGTRISSHNLNPVPFWGVGAQVSIPSITSTHSKD